MELQLFKNAISEGNFSYLESLCTPEFSCPFRAITYAKAQRENRPDMLSMMKSSTTACICCEEAVKAGRLDVLTWFRERGCPCHGGDCSTAAGAGHLVLLQQLIAQGSSFKPERCLVKACYGGHIPVAQWLVATYNVPLDSHYIADAAMSGNLDLVKWLHQQGCPWDSEATQHAAMIGNLEIFQWLLAQDPPCPCELWACRRSAREGDHTLHHDWIRALEKKQLLATLAQREARSN